MNEKKDLLKALGFSEELLTYFLENPLETPVIDQEFESVTFGSNDLPNIPNFDQLELAGTRFTYSSEE